VKLTSPEQWVCSIPYLAGFTPEMSVVTTFITNEGEVLLTMRTSIDPILDNPDLFIDTVATAAARAGAESAVHAIYAGTVPLDRDMPFLSLMVDQIKEIDGLGFLDLLQVHVTDNGNTYWRVICDCCAFDSYTVPGFNAIDQSVRDAVAVKFIGAGVAPVGKRSDIDDEFELMSISDETRSNAFVSNASDHDAYSKERSIHGAQWCIAQLQVPLDDWTTEDLIRFGLFISESVKIRDNVLYQLIDMSQDQTRETYKKFLNVYRASDEEQRAATACIVGVCAMMLGDGARARVALDLSEQANPTYSYTRLLQASLQMAMPPSVFAELLSSARQTDNLLV